MRQRREVGNNFRIIAKHEIQSGIVSCGEGNELGQPSTAEILIKSFVDSIRFDKIRTPNNFWKIEIMYISHCTIYLNI